MTSAFSPPRPVLAERRCPQEQAATSPWSFRPARSTFPRQSHHHGRQSFHSIHRRAFRQWSGVHDRRPLIGSGRRRKFQHAYTVNINSVNGSSIPSRSLAASTVHRHLRGIPHVRHLDRRQHPAIRNRDLHRQPAGARLRDRLEQARPGSRVAVPRSVSLANVAADGARCGPPLSRLLLPIGCGVASSAGSGPGGDAGGGTGSSSGSTYTVTVTGSVPGITKKVETPKLLWTRLRWAKQDDPCCTQLKILSSRAQRDQTGVPQQAGGFDGKAGLNGPPSVALVFTRYSLRELASKLRLPEPDKSIVMHIAANRRERTLQLQTKHSRVLYVVLWINAAMFVIEGCARLASHSTALLADALDMLGDALVYGFSLFVLDSIQWVAGGRSACQRHLHDGLWLRRTGTSGL